MLQDRFAPMVISATVIVMFFGLSRLAPFLHGLPATHSWAAATGAVIASLAVYRLLAMALLWLFRKSRRLRKFVLGKGFLEGTWVGHYVRDGECRFTIESFDQESGLTVISGREFSSDGSTRAKWHSVSVSIDTVRMQLVYSYQCDVFEDRHTQQGLGVFSIICESSGEPAKKLDGYAADLGDEKKAKNCEIKISDEAVSDQFALDQARKIFGRTV